MSSSASSILSSISAAAASASASAAGTADQYNLKQAGIHPELEDYREQVRSQIISSVTPLNLTLLAALLTFLYFRFYRTSTTSAQSITLDKDKPIVFTTFTPRTLLKFNGIPSKPFNPDGKVYLAVKGKVHDVTSGRNFYGPGGPYENFAGRDATRGLACQSFDEEMLTKDLDGPLDDCSDLGPSELENLQGWVERFDEKVSTALLSLAGNRFLVLVQISTSLLYMQNNMLIMSTVSGCGETDGFQPGPCSRLWSLSFNRIIQNQSSRYLDTPHPLASSISEF